MNRNLEKQLLVWKDSPLRKPLIVRGARQVGKSWLLRDFGQRHFKHLVICNFDRDKEIRQVFQNKSPQRIVQLLEIVFGYKFVSGETLLVFDEIQDCPDALNALKYFHEEMRELHVVAAGSLLGVLLSDFSYPVGAVDLLEMYPMDFAEFLEATEPVLYKAFRQLSLLEMVEDVFHRRLLDAYHQYLIVGGMPECVALWAKTHDPAVLLRRQNALLKFYEGDFGKHLNQINAAKCLQVFRSIPAQLAKDNEKFVFGAVRKGARAKDLEEAITWIVSAGLFNRVNNISKIEPPLRAYRKDDAFKLFLMDTGLIKVQAGVPNNAILLQEDYQFKGQLAENYVLQQLTGKFEVEPFYFSDQCSREIDFMLQVGTEIIPIEVKGGKHLHAISLKNYVDKRHPPYAIRFSEKNFSRSGNLVTLPLYWASRLPEILCP